MNDPRVEVVGFLLFLIFCNSATVFLFFTHLKLLMQKVFFKNIQSCVTVFINLGAYSYEINDTTFFFFPLQVFQVRIRRKFFPKFLALFTTHCFE